MSSSSLVIKVNYGETLRRFSAYIDESGHLDMDINELRAKICSLFNFYPDAEFTLTYVDEDGDIVALVDDADLFNVMTQSLKFLRIDVHLKDEKAFKYCKSSGSSTPLRSNVPHQSQTTNAFLLEALKAVPEPICEALTKLSLDLATNATSCSSVLSEIVDCVSKVGQLCVKSSSQPQPNSEGGPSGNPLSLLETDNLNASKDASATMEVLKHTGFASISRSSQEVEIGNGDGNANSPPMPTFCDFSFLDHTAADSTQPSEVPLQGKKPNESGIDKEVESVGLAGFGSSGLATSGISAPLVTSLSAGNTECPFSGVPLGPFPTNSAVPHLPSLFPPHIYTAKRSNDHYDSMIGVIHRGVRCDGCGMNPITGPRYMSKWTYNYDLCSSCFSKMGDEVDYIKFVQPFKHSLPSKVQNIWAPQAAENNLFRGFGMKPRSNLDSRFIVDVTVIDGTIMGPSTPFTKIWRMRNSGSFVWLQGTKIAWIGGDRFSNADSVDLEVTADGVPTDGELDVAVDFVAPQYPGQYTSYWRMVSPNGQKFGQRVWVLIQVRLSPKDIDNSYGLNLYMPPGSSNIKNPEDLNTSVQPVTSSNLLNPCSGDSTQPIVPEVDGDAKVHAPQKIDDIFGNFWGLNMDLPPGSRKYKGPEIVDASVQPVRHVNLSRPCTVNRASQSTKPTVKEKSNDKDTKRSGAIKYPDLSTYNNETNPISNNAVCSHGVNDKNSVEEKLLKNLEEMGFTDINLNKKILRQNDYNMEQSLSALCTITQWEPILNELEEMGFTDKEKNVRLLRKNNGSIKLVVLELLTGEKA